MSTGPEQGAPQFHPLGTLEFEPTACPVCGAHEVGKQLRKTVQDVDMHYGVCTKCNTLYANPRLTVESLRTLYGSEEFFEGRENNLNYYSFLSGETYLRRTARGRIERFRTYAKGTRLLEVASAAGFFLAEAKAAGFQAEGIEFSGPMAAYAADRWGVPVTAGSIEEVELDPLTYDVIASWGVMTILRDPVARVFSHYQYSVQRGKNKKTFEETVRASENLQNLQVKLIAGGPDLDKAKRFLERCAFVGLTEKFDLSLRVLERLSPWKLNLSYQRRVVAESNTLKNALERDERMLELAREHNKLDIELYRFAVEEIFPRLCQKAGVNPAEKVPSYSSDAKAETLNYRLSKIYSKAYRNICKFRYNVLLRDPRPRMGNTAEDIFGPLLQRDPARSV